MNHSFQFKPKRTGIALVSISFTPSFAVVDSVIKNVQVTNFYRRYQGTIKTHDAMSADGALSAAHVEEFRKSPPNHLSVSAEKELA